MRLLIVLVAAVTAVNTSAPPFLLNAPWTPFHDNEARTVNLDVIPSQVAFAAGQGASHIWITGAMSQFDQLTIEERQAIALTYIPLIRDHKMYSILHIGHQTLEYAKQLARFAYEQARPDAIAMMPPFAPERPNSVEDLVELLRIVAAEAPDLPFFYYHIPGTTHIDYPMADMLKLAATRIPTMSGIKYVDDNLPDFAECLALRTCKGPGCDTEGRYKLFWAPNPKAQALPFGARGFVMAQSFLSLWDRKIYESWPNETETWKWQSELTALSNIYGQFVGGAGNGGRCIMDMLNVPIGPPRLPEHPISRQDYDKLKTMLTDWGFFDKVRPYKASSK